MSDTTIPTPEPLTTRVLKGIAAVAAIGALALGANAIVKSNDSTTAAAGQAAGSAQGAGPPGMGAARPGPPGGRAGMGAPVSGTTLTKVSDAATAKYPGTVEGAFKLADGSYFVHVLQSSGSGEVHVLVSKTFAVTGVATRRGPGGPAPTASDS